MRLYELNTTKFLLLLIASLIGLPALRAADASRTNILFAIADDWGLHAGAYGTPWVKTPSFDRIAREGLLFRNAYTPMAKCAPSRAIIPTGRHLWQNEEAGNHMAMFPPKLKSWPEVLLETGWHMGITGKGWGTAARDEGSRTHARERQDAARRGHQIRTTRPENPLNQDSP